MKGINFIKTNNYRWLLMVVMMLCTVNVWGDPFFNTTEQCYEIANSADLNWVKVNYASSSLKSKSFKLINSFNAGAFDGIGTSVKPFDGIFDGNGKTITYSQNQINGNCGFFNCTDGATIVNLRLEGSVTMKGNIETQYGSVVGICINSKITGVRSHVTINAQNAEKGSYVGGLLAYMENSEVVDCFYNGQIDAKQTTGVVYGGICSVVKSGSIINCDFSGSIVDKWSGQDGVGIGGILGETAEGASDIVISGNVANGFISFSGGQTPSPNANDFGLIAGNIDAENVVIEGNYFTPGAGSNVSGGYGQNSEQKGDETNTVDKNAFLIRSADNFNTFAGKVNGGEKSLNAALLSDIDFTGKSVTTIGTSGNKYSGTFDGHHHVIKNININSSSAVVGLFNYVNGSTIQNFHVTGNIKTEINNDIKCGLIGESAGPTKITKVVAKIDYDAKASQGKQCWLGGFVGSNAGTLTITNSGTVGVLKGQAEWGAKPSVGGFIGNSSSSCSIENSYAHHKYEGDRWNSNWNVLSNGNTPTVTNSYYYDLDNLFNAPSGCTELTDESELYSGKLCARLNESISPKVWSQAFGNDFGGLYTYPYPDGGLYPVTQSGSTYTAKLISIKQCETALSLQISKDAKLVGTTVKIGLNLNGTDWHPLYVPVRLSYNEWKDDFEVAKIMNFHDYMSNGDRCVVLEVQMVTGGTLKDNHPYIIRSLNGKKELTFSNKEVFGVKNTYSLKCASTEQLFSFTGKSERTNLTAADYILSNGYLNSEALVSGNNSRVNACEWYMRITNREASTAQASEAPKRIAIRFPGFDQEEYANEVHDFETDINDVEKLSVYPVAYYSEEGIKLVGPKTGINITKMSDGSVKKIWVK